MRSFESNLPRIADWLVFAISILAILLLCSSLAYVPRLFSADFSFWSIIAGAVVAAYAAICVLGILLIYALMLRLSSFFDDVAEIRRAYTQKRD
jgi:hypothetical protein